MELIEKIKYIVENTDLFIQVNGTDPNIVSDWGRATRINLETKTIKFNRGDILLRRHIEGAGISDAFLRTEMPFNKMEFEIIRNYCKDDGSWERWQMDKLKTTTWEDLYDHIRNIEINKNWITKLKYWLGGKKFYINYNYL